MSQVVNWEYYSSLYSEIKQEDFSKYNQKAEMKLNIFTHNRVDDFIEIFNEADATAFQNMKMNAIKTTICELMNKMYIHEVSGIGSGVASVSNDGYSESYKVTTESEKNAELENVIRTGLSGTGLAGAL